MVAKIISLIQQKGGAGKSLITIHTAFALKRLGDKVGVLDMGTLSATSQWFRKALEKGLTTSIVCHTSADWRIQKDIETLNAQGVSFILVDTACIQASDTQTQAVLSVSDFSIIPFQAGILDEWAADETIAIVNRHRIPYRMVRNRCCAVNKPYTPSHLIPFVLNSFLSDDPAYVNALQSLTSLQEVTGSHAALQEIEILAKEICSLVQPETKSYESKTPSSSELAFS